MFPIIFYIRRFTDNCNNIYGSGAINLYKHLIWNPNFSDSIVHFLLSFTDVLGSIFINEMLLVKMYNYLSTSILCTLKLYEENRNDYYFPV